MDGLVRAAMIHQIGPLAAVAVAVEVVGAEADRASDRRLDEATGAGPVERVGRPRDAVFGGEADLDRKLEDAVHARTEAQEGRWPR